MSKLSETFGARGIKLALIGNDGVTNCGQGTDIRAPTRLKSFLGHSPSPVDFVSICEASYASIADNIKQFVAETPQLEFTLSTNGANVAQVRVKYKDTGSVVLLPQSKYSVSRRKLTLDSGVVQVGDSVMIEYEPDTKTKGDMTIGSTCRK